MSIRSKIILIFISTIFVLGFVMILSAGFVLLKKVNLHETEYAHTETRRAINAFQRELSDLIRVTRDYSGWDDSYQFVVDRNQNYIDTNMVDATFSQNRFNVVVFMNLKGEIVYQKSFDLQEKKEIPTSPALIDFLNVSALRETTLQKESINGFWMLGDEEFALVACPILNSQYEGPPRGILVFGRKLNPWMLGYLGKIIETNVDLIPLDSSNIPQKIRQEMVGSQNPEPTALHSLSSSVLNGYGLLRDGFLKPSFVLRIEIPRVYRLQSIRSLWFLSGFLGLMVIFSAILTWILLEWLVLKRLANLHHFVQAIGPSLNLSDRYQNRGNDELTQFGELVNHLLDRLARYLDDQRRVELNLRDSEKKYRTIVENINDALLIHDFQGVILDVNEHACTLFNQKRETILGKNLSLLESAQNKKLFSTILERSITSNTVIYDCEYRISEESIIYIETSSKVVSREGDGIIQSFARDITERKKLEENLSQSQKMEAIGQLAGGITHDFNNLLTGILGYADLMHRKAETGSLVANTATVIKKIATRASELTHQLLGFARSEKIQMCPVNVGAIIEEVILLLERTVDKKITFQVHLDSKSLLVLGDSGQIQQAILNLAINARDAMPSGGIITFTASKDYIDSEHCPPHMELEENSYVVVSVEDTGCGIAPEIQDRIFEPFFTTKEVGKGTGMGLSIVYGIARNHGGGIHVYSEVGHGTTFKLYLPQYKKENLPIHETISAIIEKGSGRILLIDDEETVLQCTADMVQEMGYQVVTVSSGKAGIDYYAEHTKEIDFIILDMIMPEMNGKECFLQLQKINPTVRILLSSGFTLNVKNQEFLEMGFMGTINKPFTLSELSKALTQMRHEQIK